MDGRPNKIDLVEGANKLREEKEKREGEGVVVEVLKGGKEGVGKVLRSPFEVVEEEQEVKSVVEPEAVQRARMISAAAASATVGGGGGSGKTSKPGKKEKEKATVEV